MRRVQIDYSNTNNIINNLRSIVRNLESEQRKIKSALSELYDLENYYYNKGEIVRELEYRERQIYKDIENTETLIENINNFSRKVEEVDGSLANKFKKDIKKYAKENNIEITTGLDKFLNVVQAAFDLVGIVPVVGEVFDGLNGVISLFRGKWSDAAISFVAMIPAIGDSLKGIKYVDEAAALLKYGDEVVSISKGTVKDAASKAIKNIKKEAIGVINKGENASKSILEATMDIGKDDYVLFLNNKIDTKVNLVTDGINTKGQAIVVGGCLIGDTLVFTDKGFKEIRDISIGDLVLSKNEESGVVDYKKVIETHKNSTYKSCIIRTKNSIIESTTGHLFMLKDKWWTAAIDIKEKDLIEVSNNTYEEIIEVEIKDSEYPIVTYNLTVEDNHTYYTGYDKILTHNMGKKNPCFKTSTKGVVKPKPYSKNRPSYRKGQVEQVWENAKDPVTGKVYDPTGKEITWDKSKPRNGQWDMGHIPGEKYSDMHELYMNGTITKKEFLEWYKNPDNYRPELPSTNRGHKYE